MSDELRTAGRAHCRAGDWLLAAMDAADDAAGARDRLEIILDHARADDAAHVEAFALDALASLTARHGDIDRAGALCELADERMKPASHFIGERDRTDARTARALLPPRPPVVVRPG